MNMRPLPLMIVSLHLTMACGGTHGKSPALPEHEKGSGRVLGPDGTAVAGVIVNFSDPETGKLLGEAATGSDGTFHPPVAPGTYAVAAASAVGWLWSPKLDVAD